MVNTWARPRYPPIAEGNETQPQCISDEEDERAVLEHEKRLANLEEHEEYQWLGPIGTTTQI